MGDTVTAFATLINGGTGPVTGCAIKAAKTTPAEFLFQTTDPATNALSGTPDTPVDLAAGAAQSFVIAFTPQVAFAAHEVPLTFDCADSAAAVRTVGLNTLLLSASADPVPDIVALAATVGSNGIVDIPGTTGTGVFAVATVNVGSGDTIAATADTGGASLAVGITLCETDPGTGACLSAPVDAANGVSTQLDAGETPTFGVFVTGTGNVPFDPAVNRVFVRFTDAGGVVRGATSVAARAQ